MPSFGAMGRQAGVAVSRILNGEKAASLDLPEVMPNTLNVDWRQLRRWGISEGSLPSGTIVYPEIQGKELVGTIPVHGDHQPPLRSCS